MRVLVVTVAHSPQDARIRHREIQALLDRGHHVTFVAPFTAFGVEPMPGIRCLDVPRSVGRHRLGPVWAATRLVLREARRHDLVLAHDPELLPSLLLFGHKGVWDVHEDVPAQVAMTTWVPTAIRKPFAGLLHAVELVAERRVHLLLAEHRYADRFTRPHPVVPNSPRVPGTLPEAEPTNRVVYVGALTDARGLTEMLAIAAALPPDVTLELIGNATPQVDARLRALPPDSGVDYRGFVPNAHALQRLRGALAGLALLHDHANYAHSQPSKLMEYMAHGVPVISTPNALPAALVERLGTGYVVGFGAVDEVVKLIVALRDDPARRRTLGERGHAAALAEFDWNSDGERFVDALESWCA